MTTLDTLALSSANAIHTSVSGVRAPVAGIGGAAQTAALWRMAGYATAGAAAGVAVVFALLVAGPTVDDPAENVVPTTVAVVPTTITNAVVTPTTEIPSPTQEPPVAAVPGEAGIESAANAEDVEPPMLEMISPRDGDHLDTRIVTFSGRTEPGAAVLASGKFPVVVDDKGLWAVDLVLAPGANGVVFSATDVAGNKSELRLTVHFDAEEPKVEEPLATTTTTKAKEESGTTTTTAAVEWLFTANQKYGSCSEPLPFDVFNGRAKPGMIVTVSSPHGGGTTEVNGDGAWSREVEFPSAPYNEPFLVTVTDHTGAQKAFTFVSFYEG